MWDGDIWKEWGAAEERSWLMCVNLFSCGATDSCHGNDSPDLQFGLDDVDERAPEWLYYPWQVEP